jgi:hypothetical protein
MARRHGRHEGRKSTVYRFTAQDRDVRHPWLRCLPVIVLAAGWPVAVVLALRGA